MPNPAKTLTRLEAVLRAGEWTRAHATELLVGLLASGERGLALEYLRHALGMTPADIIAAIDAARAPLQADSTCSPVAGGTELSCADGPPAKPGDE